jgi:hypothetical protein
MTPGSAVSSIHGTPSKWQEASSMMKNLSPAAKEAARLNSEILREVSYYSLHFTSLSDSLSISLFRPIFSERNFINYMSNIVSC